VLAFAWHNRVELVNVSRFEEAVDILVRRRLTLRRAGYRSIQKQGASDCRDDES
jgi:hypothetical protein